MQVWIDADACPKMIKEITYRAAVRTQITFTLVANQPLTTPLSPYIKKIQVSAGFDMADKKILECMEKGDLIVTADILLADAVVDQGGVALDPRGRLYTTHNMKQHLSTRNFNTELRSAGMITGGPATLSKKEIQVFANSLDKYLTSLLGQQSTKE
jgi:uncharacterized protein YaiI (UPF0178 family)